MGEFEVKEVVIKNYVDGTSIVVIKKYVDGTSIIDKDVGYIYYGVNNQSILVGSMHPFQVAVGEGDGDVRACPLRFYLDSADLVYISVPLVGGLPFGYRSIEDHGDLSHSQLPVLVLSLQSEGWVGAGGMGIGLTAWRSTYKGR